MCWCGWAGPIGPAKCVKNVHMGQAGPGPARAGQIAVEIKVPYKYGYEFKSILCTIPTVQHAKTSIHTCVGVQLCHSPLIQGVFVVLYQFREHSLLMISHFQNWMGQQKMSKSNTGPAGASTGPIQKNSPNPLRRPMVQCEKDQTKEDLTPEPKCMSAEFRIYVILAHIS